MKVGVIEMHRQPAPRIVTLPGRAVAYEQVKIRPRVDGVIEKILYEPGRPLKVGDPLFKLDDASYAAEVASNEAALAAAEAALPVAQAAYDRALNLKDTGYTQAEVEQAKSTLASAHATLDAAKAALEFSRIQLSWTTILSPIDGLADVASVSVGDLVASAQTDALTTVTRLDPIDVDIIETSARILSVRRLIDEGALTLNDRLDARLTLENGEVYEGSGRLVAPGNSVSTTTGTVTMRFRFQNPDRRILPGMFVRGELEIGDIQAFLVPQRAAARDKSGRLTAFVAGEDGKAAQAELTELGDYRNSWIVTGGLDEGARLIVDGLKTLRAGMAVEPVETTLDAEGLAPDPAPGGAQASAPAQD